MPLSIKEDENQTLVIQVSGRFTFDLQREFRDAYEKHNNKRHFIIDLRETDYLDSSALGMILILNDTTMKNNAKLKIINCRPTIKKIFELANLDKLIQIS